MPVRPGNAITYVVFVSKLSSDGSNVIYSTILGGDFDNDGPDNEPGEDDDNDPADDDSSYGLAIAVDSSGDAYVTGYTLSDDFPTTGGGASHLPRPGR